MSTPPRSDHRDDAPRRPITLTKLGEMRALGEPIVMVTAYDYPSGRLADAAGVDAILVGESLIMQDDRAQAVRALTGIRKHERG